ncbi:glycosyltransferase family 1 protein [Marivirga tractuosa]|uniref:glycosyltransferase family 4 protein n=1 Tax=Marivirga tractuosa TaxID=1006 RepID=UPI0035CEC99A
MKIGIEAQRIFRDKKHGMDIVTIELIRALQLLDTENEYFVFSNSKNEDISSIFLNAPSNFHLVQKYSSNYAIWEQLYLPMLAKNNEIDLLHCTSNTAPLFLNIPLILTLHDIIYLEKLQIIQGSLYQRIGNLYRRLIVPRIVHKCAKIGTVSNYEKKKISKYFNISEKKLKTYYNACSEYFKVEEDKEKVIKFLKKNDFPEQYILLFGSRDPRKNTENSIIAYANYVRNTPSKEVVPLVVLDVELKYFQNILNRNHLQEVKNYITTKRYVSNHDLVNIYNGAVLFLFLSTRESFGIPVLEAMACGTPVITSNLSSLPEVGGDAAIYVNPLKTMEIAEKIKLTLSDEAKQVSMTEKGLKRSNDFSWKLSAEKWLETYKSFSPRKALTEL